MTIPADSSPSENPVLSDKEINFQKQRKMYEAQIEQIRMEKALLEEKLNQRQPFDLESEDDDSEPYVDHKKLNKKLANFEKTIEEKIDKKAEAKAKALLEQERQTQYLKQNSDFNHVMNSDVIEKFAKEYPGMAQNILKMPDTFERQALVYETIKALKLDQPIPKQPSIQEKIDANRRSPYYQPTGMGSAPYQSQGDFSSSGQQQAYQKMQELKQRIRL